MPPTTKPQPEQRPLGIRKRTLAPILADPDNVDAAAIKRRKLEADLRKQRQPSVESIIDDRDDLPPPNNPGPPRKASTILEAADSSDDEDESMGDVTDVRPGSSGVSNKSDSDGDEDSKGGDLEGEESEDAELGEHPYIFRQLNTY